MADHKKSLQVVTRWGAMWARNKTNINKIPPSKSGGCGVYVLFDGSLPMYVGKGNIRSRIRSAARSDHRGQGWDRFSWFVVSDKRLMHDLETLMLQILPPPLRSLTRQSGKFVKATRDKEGEDNRADAIFRKGVRH